MVDPRPDDTNQLSTSINGPQVWPLVVAPVPLLRASLHLSHIVGCQGQMLETMTSSHRTGRDKVVQRETVKRLERTPRTLHGLIDHFSRRISPVRIIMGGPSVLDIVPHLELFETLGAGIVDILSIGDELRRRGSIQSRHFDVEDG